MMNIRRTRQATTTTELLVAATLLLAGLGLLARGSVGAKRLWQDTQHYQLALDELTNQMELISSMSSQERESALQNLQPSEILLKSLPDALLSAETRDDSDGLRVILNLQWNHSAGSPSISLEGWITASGNVVDADPIILQAEEAT
jgi:hypothetical protein